MYNLRDEGEEKEIEIDKIVFTQKSVTSETVHEYAEDGYDDDYLPIVVHDKGWYYLWNGHHRVISRILKGEDKVKVEFYDTEALNEE